MTRSRADSIGCAKGSDETKGIVGSVGDVRGHAGFLEELGGDGVVGMSGEGSLHASEEVVEAVGGDTYTYGGCKAVGCEGHTNPGTGFKDSAKGLE